MKRTLVVMALLLAATARAATVLTFDQVLSRAARVRALPIAATDANSVLERSSNRDFPTVRAETSVSSADNLDLFTQNVLRFNAFTALISVDYPLLDGGVRALQRRSARIDALTFRERMREMSDDLFRETVAAVARLYTGQERLRLLATGMRARDLGDRAHRMLDLREISNVTAAQWEDESIAAEGERLDLELQRLEAETHVKQLIADTSADPIEVTIDVDAVPSEQGPQSGSESRAGLLFQRRELAAEEAEAARRPQVLLSGFGGVASVGGDRQYGLYGVRMSIALPEESRIERDVAEELVRRQRASLVLDASALRKRIALLTQAVDVARQREESMIRLVSAGIRSSAEGARAAADRTRRESDLLAARVDLWRVTQLMRREGGTEPQLAAR